MKLLFTLTLVLLLSPLQAQASMESMQPRSQGNVYYLKFIKVYTATLLTQKGGNLDNILDPDVSKCLKLEYDVSLTSENFIEGADTVLSRQHSASHIDSLQEEITLLHDAYQPVQKGDNYKLCYDSGSAETTLYLNDADLVSIVSRDFSSLYFGIWLSPDNPLDKNLQRNLLKPES
jgi:hypothetical protein